MRDMLKHPLDDVNDWHDPKEIRWHWTVELTWGDRVLRREEGYAFSGMDAHGDCSDAVMRCGTPLGALPERPEEYGSTGVVSIRWKMERVPDVE